MNEYAANMYQTDQEIITAARGAMGLLRTDFDSETFWLLGNNDLSALANVIECAQRLRDGYTALTTEGEAWDTERRALRRVKGCARQLLAVMAEFPDDPSTWGECVDALDRAVEGVPVVRYEDER